MEDQIDRTEDLSHSFLNGNKGYVIDEICAMSATESAFVTGTLVSLYMLNGHNEDAASLLRLLQYRAEA